MDRFHYLAALTGPLLLSGCVSTQTAAEETVTVSKRPWFGICAGLCPNYDVTVWADGRVMAVRHSWHGADEIERFRVSRIDAARFRSILLPYRPSAVQQREPVCHHAVPPEQAQLVLKVREVEILWSSPSHRRRVIACDAREISEALRQALRAVQLYPSGRRITQEDEPDNPEIRTRLD